MPVPADAFQVTNQSTKFLGFAEIVAAGDTKVEPRLELAAQLDANTLEKIYRRNFFFSLDDMSIHCL